MNCSLLPVIGFPHLQELLSLFFNVYPNLWKPYPLTNLQIMKNESAWDCTYNYCYSALLHSHPVTRMWMTRQIIITNCLWSVQRLSTWVSNLPLPCTDLYVGPNHRTSFPLQKTMSTVWKHKIGVASEKSLTLHSWYGVRSRWWVGPMSVRRPNNKSHLYEFSRTVPNGIPWSRNNLQGCLPGDKVKNPCTAFVHIMQVIHVLWPKTY